MIKGINKKMIVVKNTGSKYFEEAHFIIRNGTDARERDIIKEASRIVGTVLTENGKEPKPRGRVLKTVITLLLSFASGTILGILLCLIS